MEEWVIVNRRGARGEHRYAAEQFGLSAESIRASCREYVERFSGFVQIPR